MAARENVKKRSCTSCRLYFLLVPLLCLVSFLVIDIPLFTSPTRRAVISTTPVSSRGSSRSCNHSKGAWIHDPSRNRLRYDANCKEIFKGWNCIKAGKDNALELTRWRWQPRDCDLPPLDAAKFLERYRNTNIGFIGDSLNRNMFVSLVCTLKRVAVDVRKWRPAGADRGFTFLTYNLTVAYHRTNLLVQYGRWSASSGKGSLESLGYKEGYRIDVDIPAQTWINAPNFHDIIIMNTGHWWWAPAKFDPSKTPMLFFEKGSPILPPISPELGFDLALKHMISFIEEKSRSRTLKFFRTQSPRHFEGGDWNQGGSCRHKQPLVVDQVELLFSLKNNGTNIENRLVNEHLHGALKGSSFQILDITGMSEFRADAHPSTAGGKKHEDCMHWCLPGLTDTWNDLLAAKLGV